MRSVRHIVTIVIAMMLWLPVGAKPRPATEPTQAQVLQTATLVNRWFMDKWPDPGQETFVGGKKRPSSLWTRGVYYEGLMALYTIDPQPEYYDYTLRWCDAHQWTPRNGVTTRDADDYCCCQTYLDMYRIQKKQGLKKGAGLADISHVIEHAKMV